MLDGQTKSFDVEKQIIKVRAGRRDAARRAADDPALGPRPGVLRSTAVSPSRCAWSRRIGRGCSSSSGGWGWRATSRNGGRRCACSSCRSFTRCTPIATATSCTSTTPRRPVARMAITPIGTACSPAIEPISSPAPTIVPFDQLPQVIDPPNGWVQNCNDSPWTSTYPMVLDPAKFAAYHRAAAQPHAAVAAQHPPAVAAGQDHARRPEGDEAVDAQRDRRSLRRRSRRRRAAERQRQRRRRPRRFSRNGTVRARPRPTARCCSCASFRPPGTPSRTSAATRSPADPKQPLTTPRGFADPASGCGCSRRRRGASRRSTTPCTSSGAT